MSASVARGGAGRLMQMPGGEDVLGDRFSLQEKVAMITGARSRSGVSSHLAPQSPALACCSMGIATTSGRQEPAPPGITGRPISLGPRRSVARSRVERHLIVDAGTIVRSPTRGVFWDSWSSVLDVNSTQPEGANDDDRAAQWRRHFGGVDAVASWRGRSRRLRCGKARRRYAHTGLGERAGIASCPGQCLDAAVPKGRDGTSVDPQGRAAHLDPAPVIRDTGRPRRRHGSPRIACSDHVNGQILAVDGGFLDA